MRYTFLNHHPPQRRTNHASNKTESQILNEIIESWNDLKTMLDWFKERKRAPSIARDADRETQRQTYHVQKRYIEAIRRASDLERVSIAEIVNRAFGYYFNREDD